MANFDSSSRFLSLIERNISPEIFFNSQLSDTDLSKLLWSIKVIIMQWKNIFPIKEFRVKRSMTDKIQGNIIIHYSHNIEKLTFPYGRNSLLTIDGYHHLTLLRSSLLKLSISDNTKYPNIFENDMNNCLTVGLYVVSYFLVNLTSLKISGSTELVPCLHWLI
jgi:hypothetical protein